MRPTVPGGADNPPPCRLFELSRALPSRFLRRGLLPNASPLRKKEMHLFSNYVSFKLQTGRDAGKRRGACHVLETASNPSRARWPLRRGGDPSSGGTDTLRKHGVSDLQADAPATRLRLFAESQIHGRGQWWLRAGTGRAPSELRGPQAAGEQSGLTPPRVRGPRVRPPSSGSEVAEVEHVTVGLLAGSVSRDLGRSRA